MSQNQKVMSTSKHKVTTSPWPSELQDLANEQKTVSAGLSKVELAAARGVTLRPVSAKGKEKDSTKLSPKQHVGLIKSLPRNKQRPFKRIRNKT